MKLISYELKEKEEMKKAGFPLCFDNRHCNTCIKTYRFYLLKREEELKFIQGFSYKKPKK